MRKGLDRRDFLKLAGVGSVVFASGLKGWHLVNAAAPPGGDFFFVQMSDTHWGFNNPAVNPDFSGTLKKAVVLVNGLSSQPDFIMFTGDLTHITEDDQERRKRLKEFREIVGALKVKDVKFMPGEHDAGLDEGKAFQELFGKTHYSFEHKGVHFIVVDNVSDPGSNIGDSQLQWLNGELQKIDREAPIVIFTHRPLFDLYPDWDWHTRDGAKALEMLKPYPNVTVFYGHIHQENHHETGNVKHHSATGLMYPLPAPGSVPVKAPVPWTPSEPYKGLGFRGIHAKGPQASYELTQYPIKGE